MSDPPRAVLVTHGRLGEELVKTAESILGPQESVAVLSNDQLSAEDLERALENLIAGETPVVLFVDLGGGSCSHVCALVRRGHPNVLIAQGVNLPMLIEFLYQRWRVGLAELKRRIETRGREGIECVGWEDAEEA